jgi:hypothetical protein
MRLSPITSYYIRKLLRQPSNNARAKALTTQSPTDALSDLDQMLQSLYPSEEMSTAIQRLESLVYIHKSIYDQTALYADYPHELIKLEHQIFRLLGCQKGRAEG